MNLLPVGSVVALKGATKKIMIIGIAVNNESSGTMYDYIGVPFPEGYIDSETMFLFMHEDIEKIEFLGFVNAEAQGFRAALSKQMELQGIV